MATEKLQVYKCEVCGNMVEVLHTGRGDLVCCGKPMDLLVENTVDASRERHVPVVEKTDGGYRVGVGETPHPMEEKHYIQWIELMAEEGIGLHFLEPGQNPEATFQVDAQKVTARAYCNLHGLWKG